MAREAVHQYAGIRFAWLGVQIDLSASVRESLDQRCFDASRPEGPIAAADQPGPVFMSAEIFELNWRLKLFGVRV